MSDGKAFIEIARQLPKKRPVEERIQDNRHVYGTFDEGQARQQAARCMDCGIPTCQAGCPLGNIIPDWNELVHRGRWREAYHRLQATNNFPEFTGRICPAPCESACVLGLIEEPVTIEQMELEIAERAFKEGWVPTSPPPRRTGKRVAVVGSGPAGLACADQLNTAGHLVTVFERDDRIGGLLRYGIPDFKMEKWMIDRRLDVMRQRGVRFEPGTDVGGAYPVAALQSFDAVVLCCGATKPRPLDIPGRDLDGIHFAWDYLHRHNKRVAGDDLEAEGYAGITARGKHVIVIGGGDTGSDCIGTANRQGAASITQFDIYPQRPDERPPDQPWPYVPNLFTTSTSHEEGVQREWAILTKAFAGANGQVEALETVRVRRTGGPSRYEELPGTHETWPADLILIAIGYEGPERQGLLDQLGVALDDDRVVKTDTTYATSVRGLFAAGDMRRGQSLVVWAISEGREAARHVDRYLVGDTSLPTRGGGGLAEER